MLSGMLRSVKESNRVLVAPLPDGQLDAFANLPFFSAAFCIRVCDRFYRLRNSWPDSDVVACDVVNLAPGFAQLPRRSPSRGRRTFTTALNCKGPQFFTPINVIVLLPIFLTITLIKVRCLRPMKLLCVVGNDLAFQ